MTKRVPVAVGRMLFYVEKVRPEADVKFGLKVSAMSGKLTGPLVESGGGTTLKVAMNWKCSDNDSGQ